VDVSSHVFNIVVLGDLYRTCCTMLQSVTFTIYLALSA